MDAAVESLTHHHGDIITQYSLGYFCYIQYNLINKSIIASSVAKGQEDSPPESHVLSYQCHIHATLKSA
jgi:hypothetical protein